MNHDTYCKNCGAYIPTDMTTCLACGTSIDAPIKSDTTYRINKYTNPSPQHWFEITDASRAFSSTFQESQAYTEYKIGQVIFFEYYSDFVETKNRLRQQGYIMHAMRPTHNNGPKPFEVKKENRKTPYWIKIIDTPVSATSKYIISYQQNGSNMIAHADSFDTPNPFELRIHLKDYYQYETKIKYLIFSSSPSIIRAKTEILRDDGFLYLNHMQTELTNFDRLH